MKPSNPPQTNRRLSAGVLATALTAALTAACGGGGEILAILQIVTPLGGQWKDATSEEILQFNSEAASVEYFTSKRNITATVQSVVGVCGSLGSAVVNLQGTLDNGKVMLRPAVAGSANCIEGSFTDLRRFAAVALAGQEARNYDNSLVAVAMNVGLWSTDNGQVTLNFDGPSTIGNNDNQIVVGCDVSVPTAPVRFNGTMRGFDLGNLSKPFIELLLNSATNAPMFSQVEFVDGGTLTLRNAAGQALTLKRKPDPADPVGSDCPP